MKRARSLIWNHFQRVTPIKAECNVCSTLLSIKGGSTANLIRHVKTKHPTVNLNQESIRIINVEPEDENQERKITVTSIDMPEEDVLHASNVSNIVCENEIEMIEETPPKKRKKNDESRYLQNSTIQALHDHISLQSEPKISGIEGFLLRVGEGLKRLPYIQRSILEIKILELLYEMEEQMS